jgi:hypothetical protein
MKGFSLDFCELHTQPSVKDTVTTTIPKKRFRKTAVRVTKPIFDCADASATDGVMGLLENFTNVRIGFAGIHSNHARWQVDPERRLFPSP